MEPITDHRSLVDALGGNKVVADGLTDCTAVRVGQWKISNRIPVEYWPDVIRLAEAAGLTFVTSDWLMNSVRPRTNSGAEVRQNRSALERARDAIDAQLAKISTGGK